MLAYTLPSDIVDISVARGGTSARPELDVKVERRTPLVGYGILAAAVGCASMFDISMQLMVRAVGCWLCGSWRLLLADKTSACTISPCKHIATHMPASAAM